MRIQIEPSEIFVAIDGVRTRVWNGTTEEGQQVFAFICCVATRPEDPPLPLIERPEPKLFVEAEGRGLLRGKL
jgi:hypothetical protein